MIINKSFKEQIKKTRASSKTGSGESESSFFKKTFCSSRSIFGASFLSLALLSGCSTLSETVASATDAIKTDVQTQHDENFRIKRIRKALLAGNISEAEEQRDTLFAPHWRCIANIEIAAAKYPTDKKLALESVKSITEEIWNIPDANKRAMALLSLLKFELATQKDATAAKETIKQTEKTIAFILDDHSRKMRRSGELQSLKEKHNHLLTR